MGLKLTSLSEDYQRGAWGLPQAVREIISNGLDGAERGQLEDKGALSVDYNPRAQRLTVTNQGVTVPASALLLGVSQSRDYAGCIGTFGEGLPMALLVLARLRRRVVITNGDERWEPKIVASPDYDGRVLAIQSRKLPKDHDCFSVVFEDVTEEDWASWRKMFLRFDPALSATDIIDSETNTGQVILNPEYVGRVYVKGVYTHSRDDLLFGYNLDIPVGRDRQYVDYSRLCNGVYYTLLGTMDRLPVLALDKLLTQRDVLETSTSWSVVAESEVFAERMNKLFAEKYAENPDIVAVSSLTEEMAVRAKGGTAVVLSQSALAALRNYLTYGQWATRQRHRVSAVHGHEQLTTEEREVLVFAVRTMAPFRKGEGKLRVVSFEDRLEMWHYAQDEGVVLLARAALRDKATAIWTFASFMTQADGAGTLADTGRFLARIIGGE
jgi:hypothetical protein